MPFTPFHSGPGTLFKAIGGERFSFMIFGGSQVLMDVEPLVRIVRGDAVVHGISHTVAGAFVVALASGAVGLPLGNVALRHWSVSGSIIGWRTALISALVGTYSHIVLDAVMHRDIHPLWPITQANDFLGIISVGALHVLCVVSGLLGGGVAFVRAMRSA